MWRSHLGFILPMLFAFSVIAMPLEATAQDMPPILAPLTVPEATPASHAAASATAAPHGSIAVEAAIPPAAIVPPAPTRKPEGASAEHLSATAHHAETPVQKKKFAALLKRLAQAHRDQVHRDQVHHETAHHETARREPPHRVVVREPPSGPPPGSVVPPPGYYPPPGPYPYRELVYGGPYAGGWGTYRGPRPYHYYP